VTFDVHTAGRRRIIEVSRSAAGFSVSLNGRPVPADVVQTGHVWSLLIGDAGTEEVAASIVGRPRQSYEVTVEERPNGEAIVWINGYPVKVFLGSADVRKGVGRVSGGREADAGDHRGGPQRVTAPMPGKIVRILVKPGDSVLARQGLVVVEAMKMENELRAVKAGTVAEVRVTEGASVEAGAVLVIVE
jgi:biotin carboxyl carrier protein